MRQTMALTVLATMAVRVVAGQSTGAVPVAPPAADEVPWGDPVEGAALRLTTDKCLYRVGEPVIATVVLRNLGPQAVSIGILKGGRVHSNLAGYRFSVIGNAIPETLVNDQVVSRRPIPLTEFGVEAASTKFTDSAMTLSVKSGITLRPFTLRTPINRLYDMTLSGTYQIQVSRMVSAGGKTPKVLHVVSNVVEIVIEEPIEQAAAK